MIIAVSYCLQEVLWLFKQVTEYHRVYNDIQRNTKECKQQRTTGSF